jgi:hypothetical protein
MIRSRHAHTLFLLLVGLTPVVGAAQAKEKSVALNAFVIRATTDNEQIDDELKAIAKQLKTQFKYTGYKLSKKHAATVKADETTQFAFGDKYIGRLTPTKIDDTRVQIKVELLEKEGDDERPKLRTVIAAQREKTVLLGGLKVPGSQDVLILAITPR